MSFKFCTFFFRLNHQGEKRQAQMFEWFVMLTIIQAMPSQQMRCTINKFLTFPDNVYIEVKYKVICENKIDNNISLELSDSEYCALNFESKHHVFTDFSDNGYRILQRDNEAFIFYQSNGLLYLTPLKVVDSNNFLFFIVAVAILITFLQEIILLTENFFMK